MIRLRLDINGSSYVTRAYKNTALQITKRVQDIKFLESSQGTITKIPFRVPLEGKLLEAIGDPTDFGREPNVDLRKTIEGSILIDSVPVYRGSFQVLNSYENIKNGNKEVEMIFQGNETNLKYELQNVTIKELLDGETVDYTVSEIKDYYDDPDAYITANGLTWDLIDYGYDFYADGGSGTTRIDDSANPLDQRHFKPCITLRKIFDLINSELEIDITNETDTDYLFEQIIPLHNNKSAMPVLDTSIKDYTGYMDRTNNLDYTYNDDQTSSYVNVNFNQVDNFNQAVFNVSSDRYTAITDGNHDFRFSFDFDCSHDSVNTVAMAMRFSAYVNGSITKQLTFVNNSNVGSGQSITFAGTVDFNLELDASDYVEIKFQVVQNEGGATSYTGTFQQQGATTIWECVASPSFTSTSEVLLAENIDPDLTCWDIVKTVIYQCCGIIIPTLNGYELKAWVDWIDDNTDVININAGLNPSADLQIEPTGITGPKSIRFTYREGKDKFNKLYTELTGNRFGELYIADTGSDFAKGEQTVELPFINGCPVRMSGSELMLIKMIDDNGDVIQQKSMLLPKPPYEILQQINLQDYFGGTAYEYFGMPYIFSFYEPGFQGADLNFGTCPNFITATGFPQDNLYHKYWRDYIRSTYGPKARKVTASIKMTKPTFKGLEMNEIIYLKQSKFRFLSVDNYNLNAESPVTTQMMQRVVLLNSDIAPYYPYNTLFGVVQWKDSSDNSDVGNGSAEPSADIEASCLAYGFFYDSGNNIGIQKAELLQQ